MQTLAERLQSHGWSYAGRSYKLNHQGNRHRGGRLHAACCAAALVAPVFGCQAPSIGLLDLPDASAPAGSGGGGSVLPSRSVIPGVGAVSGPQPDAEPPIEPILPCGPPPSGWVDDFDLGRLSWSFFSDGLGTLPLGEGLVRAAGGPGNSLFVAHTAGDGFLDWGAFVESPFSDPRCAHDVRAFAGMRFAVKAGTLETFLFELPTKATTLAEFGGECLAACEDHYAFEFAVPPDTWVECAVRFDDLTQMGWGAPVPLNLERVHSVRFGFKPDEQPFDLWLDNIEFAADVPATRCVRILDAPLAVDAGPMSPDSG